MGTAPGGEPLKNAGGDDRDGGRSRSPRRGRSASESPKRGDRGGDRDRRRDGSPRSNKIYVGQLSFEATEDQIRDAFERFGEVTDIQVMKEHDTGRSRGFGF